MAPGTKTQPTGMVNFTSSSKKGTFTGNPCTLSGSGPSATCSVTYKVAPGTQTITASYGGDNTHLASSRSTVTG
jgi:hypothetical protein